MPDLVEICSRQCGAKCCKAPGHLRMSHFEFLKLKQAGFRPKVLQDKRGRWVLDFKENGGQCPMLGEDNLCQAYEVRPLACSLYPNRPYEHCLLWPINAEQD